MKSTHGYCDRYDATTGIYGSSDIWLTPEIQAEIDQVSEVFGVATKNFPSLGQDLVNALGESLQIVFDRWQEAVAYLKDVLDILASVLHPRCQLAHTPIMVGGRLATKRRFDTHCRKRLFLYPECTHHSVRAGWPSHSLPVIRHN